MTIADETHRRLLQALGADRGGDLDRTWLEVLTHHALGRSRHTLSALNRAAGVLSASRRLQRDRPDDYQDDRHWPRSDAVETTELVPIQGPTGAPDAALLARVLDLERRVAELERREMPAPLLIESSVGMTVADASEIALQRIERTADAIAARLPVEQAHEWMARVAPIVRERLAEAVSIEDVRRVESEIIATLREAA
jgi:hypothetical protein